MGSIERLISRAIRWLQGRIALRTDPLSALRDRRPGRGLDVGCGRGDLAALLIGRGWTMTGVEPSPAACAAAAGRGVDARCGTLTTVPLEAGAYDAVVFQHSLEHIIDPVGALRTVAAALAPGGLVLITVPNFGGWQARRFGGFWFHLDQSRATGFTSPPKRSRGRSAPRDWRSPRYRRPPARSGCPARSSTGCSAVASSRVG